jgi:hypothetical protein
MAAWDAFEQFIAALSAAERDALKELIEFQRADLLAARSEEARLRSVEEFINEAHERFQSVKR